MSLIICTKYNICAFLTWSDNPWLLHVQFGWVRLYFFDSLNLSCTNQRGKISHPQIFRLKLSVTRDCDSTLLRSLQLGIQDRSCFGWPFCSFFLQKKAWYFKMLPKSCMLYSFSASPLSFFDRQNLQFWPPKKFDVSWLFDKSRLRKCKEFWSVAEDLNLLFAHKHLLPFLWNSFSVFVWHCIGSPSCVGTSVLHLRIKRRFLNQTFKKFWGHSKTSTRCCAF